MPNEFDIIRRYFSFSETSNHVLLGVGDDAAVVRLEGAVDRTVNRAVDQNETALTVATDTLVAGVHFPAEMAAEHVASRALGVNLSDFAAMGVMPRWYTLNLTLPEADDLWLKAFSNQLAILSEQYNVALIGGDTTRGPLTLSMTVMGQAQHADNLVLRRDGAREGDTIWVSGYLGCGAAGLRLLTGDKVENWRLSSVQREGLLNHFFAPSPRLNLGVGLLPYVSAAIDISDGLLADAGHIAERSSVCMHIVGDQLPVDQGVQLFPDPDTVKQWVLSGGDEYELLFTAKPEHNDAVQSLANRLDVPCTAIGKVIEGGGVELRGEGWDLPVNQGFSHFR